MRFDNRFFAILGSLLLVGGFIYFFSNIVAYVAIAWVLALILDPLKRFLQRRLRYRKFQAGSGLCAVLAMALGLWGAGAASRAFHPAHRATGQ
jgi:predicted PurR-regulated permease PerM